jgi:hypothetical protein
MVPTFAHLYHLGPVYLGADQWIGVQSVSIRPGLSYVVKRGSGNPFAAIGSIVERKPEITIRFTDVNANFTAAGLHNLFHNAFNSSLVCWLWRSRHGGSRITGVNAEHISITADLGDMTPDSVAVSRIDDTLMEAKFRVISAGLALAVDQAFP